MQVTHKLSLLCPLALVLGLITLQPAAQADSESAAVEPGIAAADSLVGQVVNWFCPDGGNSYVGKSTKAGLLVVTNTGPGDVIVEVQGFFPWIWNTYALPRGQTLRIRIAACRHIELLDPNQDGRSANGTATFP